MFAFFVDYTRMIRYNMLGGMPMNNTDPNHLEGSREYTFCVENLTFSMLADYANDFLMPQKYNQPCTYPYFKACAVLSGELTVHLMRYTTVTLSDNDVIFIGDGVKHSVCDETGTCQYSLVGLKYAKNNLRTGRDYHRQVTQRLVKPYLVIRNVPRLAQLLKQCFDAILLDRNQEAELAGHELILRIVSGFTDASSAKNLSCPESNLSRLHKINIIIRTCFDKDITLNDVAKILYLSPMQTRRIIKAHFGMTWHELLLKRRMRVALWHIGKREDPIDAIAAYVGYRSVRGFYFAFEKFYGNPPNFYRNKPELVDEILEQDEEWKDYENRTD